MVPNPHAPPSEPLLHADGGEFAPPRLRLDHELLGRLKPESTLEEWEGTLRRVGLSNLDPGGSERGDVLGELQELLLRWRAQTTALARASAASQQAHAAIVALTVVVTFLVAGRLWGFGAGLTSAALAGAAVWAYRTRAPDARPERPGVQAHLLLRRLLDGSFVDVVGATVVEHLPQQDYLLIRHDEVERSVLAADARMAELSTTIIGIRAANERLGRPADDHDIERLNAAMTSEAHGRARLADAAERLRLRLARLDADLERLRAQAARLALSQRTAQLTDGAGLDRSLHAATSLELDILEIEAELAPLALASSTHDTRIRALLEMAAASRPRR